MRISRLSIYLVVACFGFIFQSVAQGNQSGTYTNSVDMLGMVPPNQLFVGMFTYHFDHKSREERNWNNQLLGLQIDGFFAGTLMNSFDKRSWAFGISRDFYRRKMSLDWSFDTGYRVGMVSGYEDEDSIFNMDSNVIPYVDLHGEFTYVNHFGIEVMVTSSLSVCFFYRF